MEAINHLAVSFAGSPWVYAIVFGLVFADGFFPPVPSEAVVVALGALATSTGAPDGLLLVLAAAAGAIAGDNAAYELGRRIGIERWGWARRGRVARLLERVRIQLERRGALVIMTARFVPVGRVAVSVTAGGTSFPRPRFVLLTCISGLAWALYSVLVGTVVARLLGHQPLLSAVIAIVVALLIGYVVDAVVSYRTRRRDRLAAAASAEGEERAGSAG
jgi:membrane protein DedA with SNARE-associated domain